MLPKSVSVNRPQVFGILEKVNFKSIIIIHNSDCTTLMFSNMKKI